MGGKGIASTLLSKPNKIYPVIEIRLLDGIKIGTEILYWRYQFVAFYVSISLIRSIDLLSK
jgi:hypothetical protein